MSTILFTPEVVVLMIYLEEKFHSFTKIIIIDYKNLFT